MVGLGAAFGAPKPQRTLPSQGGGHLSWYCWCVYCLGCYFYCRQVYVRCRGCWPGCVDVQEHLRVRMRVYVCVCLCVYVCICV